MKWTHDLEKRAQDLKADGLTYEKIGKELGTTSIKHKIRRLQQKANQDRYKHTYEKTFQAKQFVAEKDIGRVLETHGGFGGMTEFYLERGAQARVYDIDEHKVNHLNNLHSSVTALKANSEKEILKLLVNAETFDIIDIDPYGLPSRYFPYAFGLIDDGLMFITFPMMGVAQMNKITIEHYRVFWDIRSGDKTRYTEKIVNKLKDYAFMQQRSIEL